MIDATSVDLPTRCIEVGEHRLKLADTAGQRGAYITLSHRWSAETGHSCTTADNLESRRRRVFLKHLPQTFQDAIIVTRRLGIPYLWIDSLCIVQSGDDGRDWKVEAVKMSQYYQYSVLTIAAANASSHGFLQPPTAGLKEAVVRLPYRDVGGVHKGFFYVHRRQGLYGVSSDYAKDVLQGDLLRRGWVLQEWLLSRRILHYTADQVFFECQSQDPINDFNETVRSEDLARTRINRGTTAGQQQYSLHKLFAGKSTSPNDMWRRVVQSYSGAKLTRPQSDRLVAVVGVANELHQVISNSLQAKSDSRKPKSPYQTGNTYIVGVWLQDLHIGLLWEQRDNGPLVASHCGAPTWSWAAWTNPVHWRHHAGDMNPAFHVTGLLPREDELYDEVVQPCEPDGGCLDVDSALTCLVLRGRISIVLVRGKLQEAVCQKLAEYTGVQAELFSRWVSLSDPTSPTEHIGWADIESTKSLPESAIEDSRKVVLALNVATHECAGLGLQFGQLGLSHEVYCVLFLRPADASGQNQRVRYVRGGVGRIFKKDFFHDAEEVDIELV